MDSSTVNNDELSKDLLATKIRKSKPITITLTAIEVYALVSAIQVAAAKGAISELDSMGECAKVAAKKMHDCLDPNSLLSSHLNEGWELEEVSSDD